MKIKRSLIFYNNKIFENWNKDLEKTVLIEYVLPTEDLEDLTTIKKNYEKIEQYNFEEVVEKYDLKDTIISLIFKNKNELRILSKITYNNFTVLKNQSFLEGNINEKEKVQKLIKELKTVYRLLKNYQINTSIKLPLNIKIIIKIIISFLILKKFK